MTTSNHALAQVMRHLRANRGKWPANRYEIIVPTVLTITHTPSDFPTAHPSEVYSPQRTAEEMLEYIDRLESEAKATESRLTKQHDEIMALSITVGQVVKAAAAVNARMFVEAWASVQKEDNDQ